MNSSIQSLQKDIKNSFHRKYDDYYYFPLFQRRIHILFIFVSGLSMFRPTNVHCALCIDFGEIEN